jgi:hypothetical protein
LKWRGEENREPRVLRGMKPPYIPFNPLAGYVRAGSRTCPVGRICLRLGPDMPGGFSDLEVSGPQARYVQARGQTCLVTLVKKDSKTLENLIIEGFGV